MSVTAAEPTPAPTTPAPDTAPSKPEASTASTSGGQGGDIQKINPKPTSSGPSDNVSLNDLAARFRESREARNSASQETRPAPASEPQPSGRQEAAESSAASSPSTEPDAPTTGDPEAKGKRKPTPAEIRIYKLHKENEQLKKQLEAQAQQATPAPEPAPAGDHPDPVTPEASTAEEVPTVDPGSLQTQELSHVQQSIQQLEALAQQLRSIPDGGEIKLGEEVQEFTPEQVHDLNQQIQDRRTELIGQRSVLRQQAVAQYQATAQQATRVAVDLVPELADPQSAESRWVAEVKHQLPEVQRNPNHMQFFAWALLGQRVAEMGEVDLSGIDFGGTPLGARPVASAASEPPPIVTQSSAPPLESPQETNLAKAQAQFEKDGSRRSMQALLKAQREAKRAAA